MFYTPKVTYYEQELDNVIAFQANSFKIPTISCNNE